MNLVWDIETDGLDATKLWCICAYDIDSKIEYKFSDVDPNLLSIKDGLALLSKATMHIGHNLIGYDMVQLRKLTGLDLFDKKVIDTWIMSLVLDYENPNLPKSRFNKPMHGLGGWGQMLGFPKFDFDSDKFSQGDDPEIHREMVKYCMQDVKVNARVYLELMKTFKNLQEKQPLISEGLRIEMEAAKFEALTKSKGWKFDNGHALETLNRIMVRMKQIEDVIHPQLPSITKLIDKLPKLPKYNKQGNYNAVTARILSEFLGKKVETTDTHMWPADSEFQRKTVVPATMGNMKQVKEWLYSIGWEPDDWKMEKTAFGWQQGSPKLTSTSLEKLGENGKLLDEWTTLRSRKGVLEGWIREATDGRLRGRMWTVGTPSMRCRHEVIANLPAVNAPWGKELRECLIAEDGYKVVGADSAGNQFRSLAHYAKDDKLTAQILSGDIHQYNADIIGTDRRTAKTWIYAFLFGAGSTKLGQVLTGKRSADAGKVSMDKYGNAIPGLKKLKDKLEDVWKQTSYNGPGYIPALDGRKLYTPQPYQTLNYLLQGCEALTCKSAVAYQMKKIKEENLDAYPTMFYHDETAWVASDKDAERVKEILVESFREGPKAFGVQIMDGDGSIGANYAEVH